MSENIDYLKNFDLKTFLKDSAGRSVFSLKKDYGNFGEFLFSQLEIYKKASAKLPYFVEKYCFFTKKSFEQSSSERTAIYKSTLFSGKTLLDLSAGLGVDSWAFSKSFDSVISIDIDKELNAVARINFDKLGLKNVTRIDANAYDFIKTDAAYDLIYADADRRSTSKKSIAFDSSEPDVIKILSRLFELTKNILLKLSPMIDISYLVKSLHYINDIYVISVNNEVKEILVLLKKDREEKPLIHAVELAGKDITKQFSALYAAQTSGNILANGKYFYEPAASVVKAGLVNGYAAINGLNHIAKNSVFLTGNVEIKDFIGRQFVIIHQMPFGKSALKKYFKEYGIVKANVSCRSFPVNEDEIKKSFGLTDGGDEYMFFTTGSDKLKLFYHCRKLQH